MKERCTQLKASLLLHRTASAEEIAAFWPGGSENDEPGLAGWIVAYANLVRFHGRREPDRLAARLDAALSRQLAREPLSVRCESGRVIQIHPKGYHALKWLDALDRVCLMTQTSREWALDGDDAKAAAMLAPVAESLAVRLWVWVLTHEGPEVPFPDTGDAPQPPDWIATLTIHDLLAIYAAHQRLHYEDATLISKAFPGEANATSRLSLSGFLGTVADEHGIPASDIMRRWSLGELFAQKVTAAQAAREAHERAESKAKRGAR